MKNKKNERAVELRFCCSFLFVISFWFTAYIGNSAYTDYCSIYKNEFEEFVWRLEEIQNLKK